MSKSPAPPRTFTVADAHALANRLERNQRPQSDQTMAAKLIRDCLPAGPPAMLSCCRAGDRRLGTIVMRWCLACDLATDNRETTP